MLFSKQVHPIGRCVGLLLAFAAASSLLEGSGESLAGRGLPSVTIVSHVESTPGRDQVTRTSHSYDTRGNLLQSSEERDFNLDGVPDSTRLKTFVYDSGSNLVFREERRYNQTGDLEFTMTNTFEYDHRGNQTRDFRVDDNGDDGIPNRFIITAWQHDSRGNVVDRMFEDDRNADGIIDATRRTESTYDRRGNLVLVEELRDDNGDGVDDFLLRTIQTFDSRGNRLVLTNETDAGVDGSVETSRTNTYAYDQAGRLVETVFSSGFIRRIHRNARGDAIETINGPNDGHGNPLPRNVLSYLYDRQGRLIEQVQEDDFNLDGIKDRVDTFTYSYGAHGNLVVETFARDITPGDGVPDAVSTTTYEY